MFRKIKMLHNLCIFLDWKHNLKIFWGQWEKSKNWVSGDTKELLLIYP